MNFKLFSEERKKIRMIVIAMMVFLFLYNLWHAFVTNYFRLLDFKSALFFPVGLYVFYLLPLLSVGGLFLKKHWGIQAVFSWVTFSTAILEIRFVISGPTFIFPDGFLTLVFSLVFILLIGPRELWASRWYSSEFGKSIFPAWLNRTVIPFRFQKIVFWGTVILYQGLLVFVFVFLGEKTEFVYPRLTAPPPMKQNHVKLVTFTGPFGFQVDVPSSVKLLNVSPEYGNMTLMMDKNIWDIDSRFNFSDSVKKYSSSPNYVEKILGERYGLVSKSLKWMFFGYKPELFFEIKKNDLWMVVSEEKRSYDRYIRVNVSLMDKDGKSLGQLRGSLVDDSFESWQWIYSIRRVSRDFWTTDMFDKKAKELSGKGQKDLGSAYLASAVLVGSDKPVRLEMLINYLKTHGLEKRAESILSGALMEYPKNPLLSSIKMRDSSLKLKK